MPEEWLIDGYNLLYSIASKQWRGKKLTREALLGALASFAEGRGCRVLMVLDGKGPAEELEVYKTKYFEARYSQSVTADSVIERIVYQNKENCVVVTKDRAIAQMARGSGARVMTPEDFSDLLEESQKERKDFLWERETDARGFNRPFGDKLK